MASGWERSWDKGAREWAQEVFSGRQVVSIEDGLSSSQTEEVFGILDEFPMMLVDAGSRGNMYAVPSMRRFTRAFGFEPDAEECARLNADSATLEGHKSVEHVPMALARTPGPVTLNICKNPNNTSFLVPNEALLDRIILAGYDPRNEFPVVGTFECEATTIDEFMVSKELPYLDFIKLDTQGSELDIIEGGAKTFGETLLAATIEVEFKQLYSDQPLFRDVDRRMASLGFSLASLVPINAVRREIGDTVYDREEIAYGEALYVREAFEGSTFLTDADRSTILRFVLLLEGLGLVGYAVDIAKAAAAQNLDHADLFSSIKTAIISRNERPSKSAARRASVTTGLHSFARRAYSLMPSPIQMLYRQTPLKKIYASWFKNFRRSRGVWRD